MSEIKTPLRTDSVDGVMRKKRKRVEKQIRRSSHKRKEDKLKETAETAETGRGLNRQRKEGCAE